LCGLYKMSLDVKDVRAVELHYQESSYEATHRIGVCMKFLQILYDGKSDSYQPRLFWGVQDRVALAALIKQKKLKHVDDAIRDVEKWDTYKQTCMKQLRHVYENIHEFFTLCLVPENFSVAKTKLKDFLSRFTKSERQLFVDVMDTGHRFDETKEVDESDFCSDVCAQEIFLILMMHPTLKKLVAAKRLAFMKTTIESVILPKL